MNWLSRKLSGMFDAAGKDKKGVNEGVWKKCPNCEASLFAPELAKRQEICSKCNHHLRMGARQRLKMFLDLESTQELANDINSTDPLQFKDSKRYRDRLSAAQKKTQEKEALIVMQGKLLGQDVVAVAFEFAYMGGSMGSAVGARFITAVETCLEQKIPLICFAASGGARMQEGLFSLFQMAKTSAAIAELNKKRIPYISVLTDPTYGGVTASLALLGDVNIAEPKAFIGLAGTRVIEQTVREKLPEGFQTSEFLLEHGAIDMIVDRVEMRQRIAKILNIIYPQNKLSSATQQH